MKLCQTWAAIFAATTFTAFGGAFAGNESANKALFKAAESGSVEDIRAAIKAGADVNARSTVAFNSYYDPYCEEDTPLRLAAGRNPNPEIVKALLEAGADDGLGDTCEGDIAIDYLEYNKNISKDDYRKVRDLLLKAIESRRH